MRAVFPLKAPIMLGSMRIAAREFLCVRVTTEAGIEGYAFALSRGLPSDAFIAEVLAPALVGRDSDLIGQRVAECGAIPAPSHAGMVKRAVSLIEIALWDVKGKRLKAPLWRLLGGARAEVPVLLVGGYLTADTTPGGGRSEARRACSRGLHAVQGGAGADAGAHAAAAVRGARGAARGLGLVVDTHWCWESSAAALGEI